MVRGVSSPSCLLGCALLLATISLNCTSTQSNEARTSSPTDSLAAHGLKACSESPFEGRGDFAPDSTASTTASLIADTHPDLFAGVWWDGVAGQIVFGTVDVPAATVMLDEEMRSGTTYRTERVARNLAELRVLQDRAMALDIGGPFKSASPRSWDGTVDIGIPTLDETSLSAIEAEFNDDRGVSASPARSCTRRLAG